LFALDRWQTLTLIGLLNVVFAAHSGLWGVLVIDMIQFMIKMTAVIAAAYFALKMPEVGGLDGMLSKLSNLAGPKGVNYLNMLPDFTNQWDIAVAVFIMPIAVQWWAVWYPGSEPGGGSYIAQRMLASKSEKDALGGVLFFNVAHYCLRPWPWILVALCSIIVYPELKDIQAAYPHIPEKLIGHDIAYPAMLKCLPVGWIGLMVAGLIAANSSTVLTHLNWGASYLVHDFYRRFLNSRASEKHYVTVGRLATVVIFFCAAALTFVFDTAKDNFDIILQVGAGTGLLYLLRWFWWRINAWCEIVAMVSSFGISIVWLVLKKNGIDHISLRGQPVELTTHVQLLLTVALTTVCWVTTAFIPGLETDRQTLIEFYRKVRPFGPGWSRIRAQAGLTAEELATTHENIPLALLGWVAGCTVIWSALFAVGNYLYGRMTMAGVLLGVFVASGLVLIGVVKTLWSPKSC
jgi:Na+/proline symporter